MATALVDLDSVGTTRSWAYDEATLLEPGRYTARSPMTSATFAKVFYRTFPALATMKWDNVCVRGGSVVDLLLGAEPADLDLCFYGLPDAAAVLARAADVVRFLLDAERAVVEAINTARASSRSGHSGGARAVFPYGPRGELDLAYVSEAQRVDIKAVRTGPVVTLRAGAVRVPVQLVLCGYSSLAAAARGADMAVCGALFTGERVLMDADARWSLENMAVRVPPGRFPSVARLEKYFNKGFDVVLPGLDAAKIPQGYLPLGLVDAVATPGGLRFSYKAVEGNKISLAAFLPPPDEPHAGAGEGSGAGAGAGAAADSYDAAARRRQGRPGEHDDGPSSRDVILENLAKLAARRTRRTLAPWPCPWAARTTATWATRGRSSARPRARASPTRRRTTTP
jgi:hypothetical protein